MGCVLFRRNTREKGQLVRIQGKETQEKRKLKRKTEQNIIQAEYPYTPRNNEIEKIEKHLIPLSPTLLCYPFHSKVPDLIHQMKAGYDA